MKNLILLNFFLLLTTTCISQKKLPGYIITANGDTLNGFVKFTKISGFEEIYTLYDSLGKKRDFTFAETLGYGHIKNNKPEDYLKFKIGRYLGQDIYRYLQRIVSGKITAFKYYSHNWQGVYTGIELYLKINERQVILYMGVPNKKIQQQLREILVDCSSVIEKIQGEITLEKAVALINEYNNCSLY